jgi:predicted nucleic-acid-binding Zn-ribbon protein
MQDGICPKCGSHNVYSDYDHPKDPNQPQTATTTVKFGQFTEPITFSDHYVCIDCGYTESYVTDPNKLKDIASSWIKVGLG